MLNQDICPICEGSRHIPVSEFNGLLVLDEMRQTPLCRYEYALCATCGTTFATRRPVGADYDLLYSRFNEMLKRDRKGGVEQEGEITDEVNAELAEGRTWWNLNGAEGKLARSMRKEVRNQTPHLGPIVSTCNVEGARILEIRSKIGFLSSFLIRTLGAKSAVCVSTFPIQKAVIEGIHGIECVEGANEQEFTIAAEGPFDIVIAPHVLIHSLYPHLFFSEIRRLISPKGWLYLCQEPDDRNLFRSGKNLFSELKCFHFQQVDMDAYVRCLEYNGFAVAATGYRAPQLKPSAQMWALSRPSSKAKFEPIGQDALAERRQMYERWRDESILALPCDLRSNFTGDLAEVEARALRNGYAERIDGEIRTKRDVYLTYG